MNDRTFGRLGWKVSEVVVMGEHYQVVRQRERYEDLVAREMDGIETVKSDAKSLKLVKQSSVV